MDNIVGFITLLSINNNREWFNANRELYDSSKTQFDKRILNATPKECVFRIYRDVRFSHDKRPYKQQFSGFISYPLGWKSKYAGYYIHVDAEEAYFSAGIWRPESEILKKLRWGVANNYDELTKIRNSKSFREAFGDNLYDTDKLKRLPTGFPKDFIDHEIIKLKHYMVNHHMGDAMNMSEDEFVDKMTLLAKKAYPFIKFLNDIVDE